MTQDITVPVPDDRVPEFYEWFGRWLSGERSQNLMKPTVDLQAWSEDDAEKAQFVWEKLSAPAQKLLKMLANRPGVKIHRDAIADHLGLKKGKYGLAGVLAWPMRHSKTVIRKLPVLVQTTAKGTYYWMEPGVARLFDRARKDA